MEGRRTNEVKINQSGWAKKKEEEGEKKRRKEGKGRKKVGRQDGDERK